MLAVSALCTLGWSCMITPMRLVAQLASGGEFLWGYSSLSDTSAFAKRALVAAGV